LETDLETLWKDQIHIQVSNIAILVLMVHKSFQYFNSCSS
jgi:hypothetical protein